MAFCQNCGKKLDDGAKFCPECGKPVNHQGDRRRTTYEGDVHKCPQCGEIVDAFQAKCSSCGFEFRNTKPSEAVTAFAKELQKIYHYEKPKNLINVLNNMLGNDDINQIRHEKAVAHIRNFTIPNDKEDIIEFLILASSNMDPAISLAKKPADAGLKTQEELTKAKELYSAWMAKVEQSYEKALFLFQYDPDFFRIQQLYQRITGKVTEIKQERQQKRTKTWLIVVGVILGWCLLSRIIMFL